MDRKKKQAITCFPSKNALNYRETMLKKVLVRFEIV